MCAKNEAMQVGDDSWGGELQTALLAVLVHCADILRITVQGQDKQKKFGSHLDRDVTKSITKAGRKYRQ